MTENPTPIEQPGEPATETIADKLGLKDPAMQGKFQALLDEIKKAERDKR